MEFIPKTRNLSKSRLIDRSQLRHIVHVDVRGLQVGSHSRVGTNRAATIVWLGLSSPTTSRVALPTSSLSPTLRA
jgi:hypothetical protein